MVVFDFIEKIECQTEDEKFMLEALKEAFEAYKRGEVPVGAVLVLDQKVIARGYNLVESLKDAKAHAEMICLSSASKVIGDWRLLDTTLYSTLEPCCMCAGALILSRVKRVCFGARDIRHGGCGSFVDLFEKKHPIHQIEVSSGVLAFESQELLRLFFKEVRKKNGR
jgi:tRNA(adenine34) deaminase